MTRIEKPTSNEGSAVTRITTAKTIATKPPRARTCSKFHARQPVGPIPSDVPLPDVESPYVCGESIRSHPARPWGMRQEDNSSSIRFPVGADAYRHLREGAEGLSPR